MYETFTTMKTSYTPLRRAALVVALSAVSLMVASTVEAKSKKPAKHRGVVHSVDLEEESMVLIKPGKPDKTKTVYWVEDVKLKPSQLR